MMQASAFLLKCMTIVVAFANPIRCVNVVHESRHPSTKWLKSDRVESRAVLPVRIGLVQPNLENGYDYLMNVSHPASQSYAKFWTPEQVIEAFAPSEKVIGNVRHWLTSNGISKERIFLTENKGWLAFDASAAEIENLLDTELHTYNNAESDEFSIGCDHYHVPANIQPHIDYITPGVKLSAPLKKRTWRRRYRRSPLVMPFLAQPSMAMTTDLSNCDRAITPQCIRALYQIPRPQYVMPHPNNTLGIFEDGDYYAQEDLDKFFMEYAPNIPNGTHPQLNSVDGGQAPVSVGRAGVESGLDFQLAYPLIYPQEITLFQTDDKYYAHREEKNLRKGEFNTFLDSIDGSYCTYTAYGIIGDSPKVDATYPDHHKGGYKGNLECGVYKPTNVISISYGAQEDDQTNAYQKRQCNEYMKLGLQGTTVLFASGDTGVAGFPDGKGRVGNANGCLGPGANIFSASNPNSCPYVTNVGATEVAPGNTVKDPEVAAHARSYGYSSSGGFSQIFPAPQYQKKAIDTYFQKHDPGYKTFTEFGFKNLTKHQGRFNRLGRGIPDVAANGMRIAVFHRGQAQLVSGTSASCPIFASVINRIIEERISHGKGPLGFINPVLYENPQILNDITEGNNPGCGTVGFHAVPGWDPVTGLGTPNYPKMRKLFLELP